MKTKKTIAFAIACMFGTAGVFAQNDVKVYYYDEALSGETMLGGGFSKVSANGEYAVGSDNMLSGKAFMWTKTSGEISLLNENGGEFQYAYDVANDGTVVGVFYFPDKEITVNGWDGSEQVIKGCYLPSTLKDGVLTELEMPAGVSLDFVSSSDYGPQAVAVSADGRFVAGYGFYNDKGANYPILWKDGEPQEFLDLQLEGQGFIVNDMSEDGTLIAGTAESERGDRIPAVIENGVLKKLFEIDMNDDAFYEGVCWRVDEENNVVGYMSDIDGSYYGFIYNSETGLKKFDGSLGLITRSRGADFLFGMTGATYGTATVTTDNETKKLDEFYGFEFDKTFSNVMDCSADGNVLVGNGMISTPMGAVNCPFVIAMQNESSISGVNGTENEVAMGADGLLRITGDYTDVQIYNVFGAKVFEGAMQNVYDLSTAAPGVYVVNVNGAAGTNTFKVVKK